MKTIFKLSLALVAAAGMLFSCAPMDKDAYGLGTAPLESQLSFTQSASSPVSANIITLTNTSSTPGVALWDLGNGTTAKGDQVTASYPFAGSYTVTMTLFNDGGGTAISQVINIANDDYGLLDTPGFRALTGGADATDGKTWVLAKYTAAHIAVDDVNAAPRESGRWWDCPPLGKEGSSLYSSEYTFIQRGTKLVWVNDGSIYTNQAGMDLIGIAGTPNAAVGDFDIPYTPADNLTFILDEENMTLTLSGGAWMGFYCGASTFNILRLDEHELTFWCRSVSEPGNAWYATYVPKDELKEPEEPEVEPKPESEDAWFRPNQPTNLLGNAFSYESWFSGADWAGGLEAGIQVRNEISITVPDGIGGSEWMGQFKIHTGIPAAAMESYDFSAKIRATQAGTATIKMTSDEDPEKDSFFYDGNVAIAAGETVLYQNPDKRMYDAVSGIMLVFDFGRFPAGTVITISDLCLQKHIPLSDKPEVKNLWPEAAVTTSFWFSKDDWQGTLEPTFSMKEGNGFELTVPDGIGGAEWMGQFALHTDISAQASHRYEFSCKITSDAGSTATIKLTNDPEADSKVFFYDNAVNLINGTTTYQQVNIAPASEDAEAVMLIFDFGRTPAGTKIVVSDIVFQEYID